jgi:hypothetical protein
MANYVIVVKMQMAHFNLKQFRKAQIGEYILLYSFFNLGLRWRVGGKYHILVGFSYGKETRYPYYRRLGGPQDRSREERNFSTSPVFNALTFQPVASRCRTTVFRSIYYRCPAVQLSSSGCCCCCCCYTGFYNPLAGFSLLILEVPRSHTMTQHSR